MVNFSILPEKCQNAQALKVIFLTPLFKMLSFEDKFTYRYETNLQMLQILLVTQAIFELFQF